ncbi:endopeptidase La [candidate division FCPU426 bacterium]|nr:endopeptidase La [candidate division FCPU426 bacterium]
MPAGGRVVLPLMPLRDLVVFPHMIVPLFVGREKSVTALEAAMLGDRMIALAAQVRAQVDDPSPEDLYPIGTRAQILQVLKMPDNTIKVLIEGKERIRIIRFLQVEKYVGVHYEPIKTQAGTASTLKALMRNAGELFEQYARLNKKIPADIVSSVAHIEDRERFTDIVAAHIGSKVEEKQKLLSAVSPQERLELLVRLLSDEVEILEIERRIKGRVRKQMESTQKEYYLQEQMKAIRKELGHKDEESEIDELAAKIKKAKMPPEAEEKALKELGRLERMQPMSPEAAVIRTYIDWFVSLPWAVRTKEKLELRNVARQMDKDHYGLKKVKERILEYLAVRKLAPKMKGPILCLVGPPGVGKTSLARSLAKALNRNFVRISLGGVRDEAEIRGHRRTYIGALPGRIIQAFKTAKSKNPLILLDELDKIGSDFRGDPAAALLEVLDPEQNASFSDHYLEAHFDLSEVMFIATANVVHNLHPTLKDRMEIIEIPGYTLEEKIEIAGKHLVVRLLEEHGLTVKDIEVSKTILEKLITHYTSEAGVRNLNRELAAIMRKITRRKVEKRMPAHVKKIRFADVVKFLGPPRFLKRRGEKRDAVGVAAGLAWTEVGGEILTIEVTLMPGKGQLILTGKLGEVMKESAQAAVSYARTHAQEIHLAADFYQKTDIHIHVPEGAIPKDGPSAGVAMATAIISALTGKPVRKEVAMTGEITLRGRVLIIGGLKEKLLAALRAQIKTVIIPKENGKDLEELPVEAKKALNLVMVTDMSEVLPVALADAPVKKKRRSRKTRIVHQATTADQPAGQVCMLPSPNGPVWPLL